MPDRPAATPPKPAAAPGPGGPTTAGSALEPAPDHWLSPASRAVLPDLAQVRLDQPLGQLLEQVAALAADVLRSVDGLSLTVVDKAQPRSTAFTSAVAAVLDEGQYPPGTGPYLQAARTGTTIRLDMDGRPPQAYAELVAIARRHGICDVVAVGIPPLRHLRGTFTLYATQAPIDDGDVELTQAFAAHAAVTLANAMHHDSSTRLAAQLAQALLSRAVIEQAKGVLMALHGLDADTAFDRLSRNSQHTNTKLRDLAADIVARTNTRTSAPTADPRRTVGASTNQRPLPPMRED